MICAQPVQAFYVRTGLVFWRVLCLTDLSISRPRISPASIFAASSARRSRTRVSRQSARGSETASARGMFFRKLDEKACVFIEYAPLESAWVPIVGDNYIYIYCLWVLSENKGKGYGRRLMESCIADAKAQCKSGVCMLGAKKQKAWLSDQSFAKKFGFETVDETENGYELLALSFDGTKPRFAENAKKETIDSKKLTVYYDAQCPFIPGRIESNRKFCEENGIDADFIEVDSLEKAKNLPCVFNNWAVFCGGKFVTVNLLDERALKKLSDGGK